MRKILVFSSNPDQLKPVLPETGEILFFDIKKSIQKSTRSINPGELLLHITTKDQTNTLLSIAEYVRTGLSNKQMWLRVLLEENISSEQDNLINSNLFNDIIILDKNNTERSKKANVKLINHIDLNKELLEEKEAQTEMLSSINRFSQHRQPMQKLIHSCAESLTRFCHGYTTVLITPKKITALKNVKCEISESALSDINTQESQLLITEAMQCRAPKIELLPENLTNQGFLKVIDKPIGSYITFPIIIYNNILASIICFIAEEDLDKISTTKINIMRDTSNQLQVILERRFAESKISSQYQRLKSTVSELKVTQDQLIHSEKMASVGQMAAGLAHEINNPLAFVLGNFGPLEEYLGTIVDMLNFHDNIISSLDESADTVAVKDEVNALKEENDLEFMLTDVKAIVNDSREGLLRVRDIISDLSSFTRKDKLETSNIDISLLVKETFRLLKYEIGHDVKLSNSITTSSSIVSHRGFIQQILTNLIKNSNHALADQTEKSEKSITLKIYESKSNIVFSVLDNGPGISEEIQKQIFDPFFTTKEVGKGTGLGLSVSYNLAKKMGGILAVDSDGSSKTEFKLVLPIEHQ